MRRALIVGAVFAGLFGLRWALADLVVERGWATLLLTVPDDPAIVAPIALVAVQLALYVVAPCLVATWALDAAWVRLKARRQGDAAEPVR